MKKKESGGPAPIQMQRLTRSQEKRNSPQQLLSGRPAPIFQEIERLQQVGQNTAKQKL